MDAGLDSFSEEAVGRLRGSGTFGPLVFKQLTKCQSVITGHMSTPGRADTEVHQAFMGLQRRPARLVTEPGIRTLGSSGVT